MTFEDLKRRMAARGVSEQDLEAFHEEVEENEYDMPAIIEDTEDREQSMLLDFFRDTLAAGEQAYDIVRSILDERSTSAHQPVTHRSRSATQCAWCHTTLADLPSTPYATARVGKSMIGFFQKRSWSAMGFDDNVFPSFFEQFESEARSISLMRADSYRVKDYDSILKCFLAWLFTLRCDDTRCQQRLKLQCECDNQTFPRFTYDLIVAMIDNKTANGQLLLKKLVDPQRTVETIVEEFTVLLPADLRSQAYFENEYKQHLVDWVSFELYNFQCTECGHVNKSIMVGRMFEYCINLKHCRVCMARPQWVDDRDREEVDLDLAAENAVEIDLSHELKHDDSEFDKYECGVSVRYTAHVFSGCDVLSAICPFAYVQSQILFIGRGVALERGCRH